MGVIIKARPDCDLCSRPSTALKVRIRQGDPTSERVALDHQDCYLELLARVIPQAATA